MSAPGVTKADGAADALATKLEATQIPDAPAAQDPAVDEEDDDEEDDDEDGDEDGKGRKPDSRKRKTPRAPKPAKRPPHGGKRGTSIADAARPKLEVEYERETEPLTAEQVANW